MTDDAQRRAEDFLLAETEAEWLVTPEMYQELKKDDPTLPWVPVEEQRIIHEWVIGEILARRQRRQEG